MRGVRVVAVAVALATLGPFGVASGKAAKPTPPTPPTLSGVSFHQDAPTIDSINCGARRFDFTYSARGTASGPYPGIFTESGSVSGGFELTATFTIDSPVGRVTGTIHSNTIDALCSWAICSGEACNRWNVGFTADISSPHNTYEATITTPGGTFTDHGFFRAQVYRFGEPDGEPNPADVFHQSFRSALDAPIRLFPNTKDQCKKGGWREFDFESKRECIRFVKHQARQSCRAERDEIGRDAFREKYGRCKHHGRAIHNCIKQAIGTG